MRKVTLMAAGIALGALANAPAQAVSIANPSFESFNPGFDPSTGSGFLQLSGSQLPGWTINGSIDHIQQYWTPQDGLRSIDLNGLGAGTISQTLTGLTTGTQYIVSFFISGNPDNAGSPNPKTATLTLGSLVNPVSYTLTAANSSTNMLWQQVSYAFVADETGTALVQLASTQENAYGLAVDNFSISAAPEPATWGMMIFGFGVAGFALRRRHGGKVALSA